MRINYALLCDYALMSSDRKPSALGIFSKIQSPLVPVMHPQAFFVFEIGLDHTEIGREIVIRIECVDADGRKLLSARTGLVTQGSAQAWDQPAVPQILKLPPLGFSAFGRYEINIFFNDSKEPAHRTPFELVQTAPPSEPSPAE